jgi:DNA-binding CsgD family transcriptional regulator
MGENGDNHPWTGRGKSKRIMSLVGREAIKEREVVEDRLAGKSFYLIGEERGISPHTARKHFQNGMKKVLNESQQAFEEALYFELARLEMLWNKFWARAQGGNIAAGTLCLAISKRRSDLLGLDSAKQIQINHNHEVEISKKQWEMAAALVADSDQALALEKVAAVFAHGEDAVDVEWEEAPFEPPPGED